MVQPSARDVAMLSDTAHDGSYHSAGINTAEWWYGVYRSASPIERFLSFSRYIQWYLRRRHNSDGCDRLCTNSGDQILDRYKEADIPVI